MVSVWRKELCGVSVWVAANGRLRSMGVLVKYRGQSKVPE